MPGNCSKCPQKASLPMSSQGGVLWWPPNPLPVVAWWLSATLFLFSNVGISDSVSSLEKLCYTVIEGQLSFETGEKQDKKKDGTQQKREDQLSHLNADITAPLSPAASSQVDVPGTGLLSTGKLSGLCVSSSLQPATRCSEVSQVCW